MYGGQKYFKYRHFHETRFRSLYPDLTNNVRSFKERATMDDRERSAHVMSDRIVRNTRKQYQGVINRFRLWLTQRYALQIENDHISVPLDNNACLEFLAYMPVKRDSRGLELVPVKSNFFLKIHFQL